MAITFCNLIFKGLKREEILNMALSEFVHVITISAESIVRTNETPKLRKIINENYTTFDGQIPYMLAKIKNKHVDFEKISGSDFIYDVCRFAQEKKWKIFLLGGKDYSNQKSVQRLNDEFGLNGKGLSCVISYPFRNDVTEIIRKEIKEFSPDVIFVALGIPKQEYWIDENRDFLIQNNVKLAIGCGGTLEFFSGTIRRSPIFFQKTGLESLYRFIIEPKFFRFKRIVRCFLMFKYL